jgi:serine/threonine protein kinase
MSMTSNKKSLIDELTIGKILGSGAYGHTYLAIKGDKKYAMKVEKIIPSHTKYDIKLPVWREIEFAKKFGEKYPDQFMKLYDYRIVKDSENVNHLPILHSDSIENQERDQVYHNALIKSPYSIYKVYSLKQTTLEKMLNKLSAAQKISILMQIVCIFNILRQNKSVHGDVHYANIGLNKTTKNTITIDQFKIPTYGYICSLLDYGTVLSKSYKLKDFEKNLYDGIYEYNETLNLFSILHNNKLWKVIEDMKLEDLDHQKIYKKVCEFVSSSVIAPLTKNLSRQLVIFEGMFPEELNKIQLGSSYKEIKFQMIVSTYTYLYCVINVDKPELIIKALKLALKEII